jgi:hypothetical protein
MSRTPPDPADGCHRRHVEYLAFEDDEVEVGAPTQSIASLAVATNAGAQRIVSG